LFELDAHFMRQALALAAQGLGRTSPNPAVGAVVVKDGAVVGQGWHRAAGQPHAEVEALREAGEAARGATVYVTLEPCSHHGRTPPCTAALIAAGVKRVVYACPDCDERCAGKAEAILREAGIEAQCGPLGDEARRLNEAYFKFKQTCRPFVTLKLALTLDGRCSTRTGDSKWITSEESRRRVHQMRDQVDAVMVGGGTVRDDSPRLTVRLVEPRDGRQPIRVVLDTDGISREEPMLREPGETIIFMSRQSYNEIQYGDSYLPEESDQVEIVPLWARQYHLDLEEVLEELGSRDIMSVLLEGGPSLAGRFLEEGLVDKLVFFYAPKLLLDDEAFGPRVRDREVGSIAEALNFEIEAVERVGPDLMVTLYPR
jgi:diaminohydroxyphosphoribosylaminopyrimidine deaminase/5-amino-6-(5-phosphoribosylamino)uracil reductase